MSRPPVYRHCRSSIYVTTNPNVPIEIGTPGQSIFIGTPGPTIFNSGGANPPSTGLMEVVGANVVFNPVTVPVVVSF